MRNESGHEKKSRVCAAKVGLIVCALAFSVFASPVHADELVRTVQKKLTSLGYYKGKADGSEGSMTSAAIRRFQIAKKLKVTGSLNRQTLDSLGLDGPVPAPSYTAIRGLFEGGPLAKAESKIQVEAVRLAQKKLAELGYYAGPHSGLPSTALTEACKEWQMANERTPTGKLDTTTLAGLGIRGD